MVDYKTEREKENLLLTFGYIPSTSKEIEEIKKAQAVANEEGAKRVLQEAVKPEQVKLENSTCPFCGITMASFKENQKELTMKCPSCGFIANFLK